MQQLFWYMEAVRLADRFFRRFAKRTTAGFTFLSRTKMKLGNGNADLLAAAHTTTLQHFGYGCDHEVDLGSLLMDEEESLGFLALVNHQSLTSGGSHGLVGSHTMRTALLSPMASAPKDSHTETS